MDYFVLVGPLSIFFVDAIAPGLFHLIWEHQSKIINNEVQISDGLLDYLVHSILFSTALFLFLVMELIYSFPFFFIRPTNYYYYSGIITFIGLVFSIITLLIMFCKDKWFFNFEPYKNTARKLIWKFNLPVFCPITIFRAILSLFIIVITITYYIKL